MRETRTMLKRRSSPLIPALSDMSSSTTLTTLSRGPSFGGEQKGSWAMAFSTQTVIGMSLYLTACRCHQISRAQRDTLSFRS